MENREYTPEVINELKDNEIFVFGSNTSGIHAGGAARFASDNCGAIWGQAEGLQGNSYAIPTMHTHGGKVLEKDLIEYFIKFLRSVEENIDLKFYLTKVGCGIAGWHLFEIKEIFWSAAEVVCEVHDDTKPPKFLPKNLILPKEFYD